MKRFLFLLLPLLFLCLQSNAYKRENGRWYVKNYTETDASCNVYKSDDLEQYENKSWTGSSVVIGSRHLVTNFHVVDGAKILMVSNSSENYKAEVIAVDKVTDLAIIKVIDTTFKGFDTPNYGIITNTIDIGSEVFVLGYPLTATMGENVKLTTGIVSSKTGFQGDLSTYQISAPIQQGNSGSPLFDKKGNLIGIVNAKHNRAENVGYAIKLSYLRNLIESCNETIEFNFQNKINELSFTEKIKNITPFVYIVKVNYIPDKDIEEDKVQNNSKPATSYVEDEKLSQEYYDKARKKLNDKKYKEAYELATKSVSLCPHNENHYLKAILAIILSDYNEAIESSKYCINHKFEYVEMLEVLAESYFELENWKGAIEIYTELLANDRSNLWALYNRGLCRSYIGDIESSTEDYKTILKYDGLKEFDYGTVYNNIAYNQMSEGDLHNSQLNIIQALNRNHLDGYIWDTLGELMYKLGKYEECVRYMGAAITCGDTERKSFTDNSYYYRGLANKKLGYDADALDDLKKAKKLGKIEADSIIQNEFYNNNLQSGKFLNVYKKPKCDNNSRFLKIESVESTEEYTKINFYISEGVRIGSQRCNIDKNTYITEGKTKKKLYLIKAENISYAPDVSFINEKLYFSLIFPPISNSCTTLNLVEDIEGEGFRIEGVILDKDYYGY